MEKISRRFLLTNILTAVSIVLGIKALRAEGEDIWEQQNTLYGVVILLAFLVGAYFSVLKAKELASKRQKSTSIYQNLFLMILYLYAIFGNIFMSTIGVSYIFGGLTEIPAYASIGLIILFAVGVGSLIWEGASLGKSKKPPISKLKSKVTNFGLMFYTSMGIGVAWQLMIVGGDNTLAWGAQNFWGDLISSLLAVVVIVIPFDRLFWYEIMAQTNGWKDNLKVLWSLCFVIAAAIVPLFF
ncbi:MAG: hypothetical protein QNK23_11355 [Crocinitomicaceae bacterium]|nr:hypothetical protein [Crocinitomicaceae bacterium]